ncbi:MAG: cytochrome c3 family protein [Terracidiphilus sp.]
MSIRKRTTKLIARRHDLSYFKRMSPLRAWQWGLAIVALACAVVWFGAAEFARGNTAFSSGPMSSSHAIFGERCEVCHVPVIRATRWTPSFGRRNHVPDSACLSCHAASPHHPAETTANPTCASCHTEHVGATHLASTADAGCTRCHASLHSRTGLLTVAANISSFASEHPAFRELRTASPADRAAAFALRFNHAEHMHPGLKSPEGKVTLQCQSCHAPAIGMGQRQAAGFMPVSFAKNCQSCHTLDFDAHSHQEAPHGKPEEARSFVIKAVTEFAQTHPAVVAAEILHWPNEVLLPGQMRMPPPRSTAEWIANRINRAEVILWRGKCGLCHRDLNRGTQAALTRADMPIPPYGPDYLPNIEPSKQPARWFTDANFSHPAHQEVQCAECHNRALTSSNGSDLLLPAIATCRRCHDGLSSPQGPPVKIGHAESGCFLCHSYHGSQQGNLAAARRIADLVAH